MERNTEKGSIFLKARIDSIFAREDQTTAYASVTLGDAFTVHGIRIIEKDNKVSVYMPSRTTTENGKTKYVDIFHPIAANARAYINATVTEAYEKAMAQRMEGQNSGNHGYGMSHQM